MTRKFTTLCVLLGVVFAACKTETVNRKGRLKSGAKAAISDSCSQNLSSTLGQTPASQSSLNSLSIPSSAISGNENQINISASQIASLTLGTQSALGPSFIMWKVCDVKGSNCSNKGEFHKSYDFNVSNITDIPKGIVEVTVKACVDSLQFIVPADQGRAANQCTNAEPCFCGAETKTKYTNNDIGSNPSPKFVEAADKYQKDKTALLTTAQSYIGQALACKDSTTAQAHLRQYIQNIAALSAAEMASYVESYGSLFAEIMRASQEKGVDGQCALITDENGAPIPSGAVASDPGSIIPSPETDPAVANETPADTSKPSGEPAAASGRSTGSYVLLGLGSFAIIAGGVAAGAFSLMPTKDSVDGGPLANRVKSRIIGILDKSRADRFNDMDAQISGMAEGQENSKLVKYSEERFKEYKRARKEYFADLDELIKGHEENMRFYEEQYNEALKNQKEFSQKTSQLNEKQGLLLDRTTVLSEKLQKGVVLTEAENVELTTKQASYGTNNSELVKLNLQFEDAIYKVNSCATPLEQERADPYGKRIQLEKDLWPESSKETFAQDAPDILKKLGTEEGHVAYKEKFERLRSALTDTINGRAAPASVGFPDRAPKSNSKARLTQKQAGAGVAGGLIAVGAGVIATVVGAKMQLATDDPCSSFGTTIARMENQLYKQSQTIQADLNALSALQR